MQAQRKCKQGLAVIIDVREPAEYAEGHMDCAINIPTTTYHRDLLLGFKDQMICLICESGSRATQVATKLQKDGFEQVRILETQMADAPKISTPGGWTIDRQFRMTLGILIAIFLLLESLEIQQGIIIPLILGVGLITTAILDRCYLRVGIARLPWNRERNEIF